MFFIIFVKSTLSQSLAELPNVTLAQGKLARQMCVPTWFPGSSAMTSEHWLVPNLNVFTTAAASLMTYSTAKPKEIGD